MSSVLLFWIVSLLALVVTIWLAAFRGDGK